MQINKLFPHLFALLSILTVHALADPLYAQSEDQGQIIKWKEINGVSAYKFELENSSGENVISENVDKNFYEVKLGVGKYRFRISALNKFNKIGRVYNWQPLEVQPVKPPVIKQSPTVFNPKESGNTIDIKGEYLHRGTSVLLKSPTGKTIQAKKEVLADGSGIRIIMPENLEDGDYSVSIQNTVGKPVEQKVQLNSKAPTQISKVEIKNEPDDTSTSSLLFDSKKKKYVIPMLWRSALVPGWGHEYVDKRNIASIYFYSALVTGLYALNRNSVYQKNRNDYENASRNYLVATATGNSSLGTALFFEQEINSKFKSTVNTRTQYTYSAQAFSLIYITSLIHAVVNGTQMEASQTFQFHSIPEYYNNEMGTKYTVIYNYIY